MMPDMVMWPAAAPLIAAMHIPIAVPTTPRRPRLAKGPRLHRACRGQVPVELKEVDPVFKQKYPTYRDAGEGRIALVMECKDVRCGTYPRVAPPSRQRSELP
jgi:hypothetical protein